MEDESARRDRADLLEIGGHQQDRGAFSKRTAEQLIDLGLCSDIDASRGLLEDKQPPA